MEDNFWVIGDVAGEYDALLELVALLPKDAKLVFVGDLNDRGPMTKEYLYYMGLSNLLFFRSYLPLIIFV